MFLSPSNPFTWAKFQNILPKILEPNWPQRRLTIRTQLLKTLCSVVYEKAVSWNREGHSQRPGIELCSLKLSWVIHPYVNSLFHSQKFSIWSLYKPISMSTITNIPPLFFAFLNPTQSYDPGPFALVAI